MIKEFDWKCKACGRDIPQGEGHIEEFCLKCAKEVKDNETKEVTKEIEEEITTEEE